MKRFGTVCLVLILVALVAAPVFDATAASNKVMRVGRSLNSMTAPVRGAVAPPWNISTGLRAVGIQSKAWFTVDTTAPATAWTLTSKPAGSTTTLDTAAGQYTSIKPDVVGEYIVGGTAYGKTTYDTVFASTYAGVGTDAQAGCFCHPSATAIKTSWAKSVHGTMFKRGITGYLEVERGKGAYAASCIKCHTTGWDDKANNNNFGWQAKQSGWDTTWYKGLEFLNGDYWITTGDTSKWMMLNANQQAQGNIGCEQCHGPAASHKAGGATPFGRMIGLTRYKPDMCNQCHDGSRRHSLGTFYLNSGHYKVNYGGAAEGGRYNCQPCHTGAGMMYYLEHNKDTTGIRAAWNLATMAGTSISCQVCHDPHGTDNAKLLRTMTIKGDTLKGGYKLPAEFRTSNGAVCLICHGGRLRVQDRITTVPPYYGWADRNYPHYNMQGEMLFGAEAYQYGDTSFTGVMTHGGVEGGCVGCHMQGRSNRLTGPNPLANHSFSMTDTMFAAGAYKPTDACAPCHGEIADFDEVRAFFDYDRNGKIEGVQTEIHHLLDKLKAILPKDSATGEPVTMMRDSLKVKNRPDLIHGIWNYYFVKYDGSYGVHNAKYAVALLYKALGWKPLNVKQIQGLPTEFALEQNYPNPFNPTTTIRFSLPTESNVRLQVFDINGALVKTVVNETLRAGTIEASWDGTNESGSKVASGMYLYRLVTPNFSTAKKMLLMK